MIGLGMVLQFVYTHFLVAVLEGINLKGDVLLMFWCRMLGCLLTFNYMYTKTLGVTIPS